MGPIQIGQVHLVEVFTPQYFHLKWCHWPLFRKTVVNSGSVIQICENVSTLLHGVKEGINGIFAAGIARTMRSLQ